VREDLYAEAKKLVLGCVFEPGTGDGRPQEYKIHVTVHFRDYRRFHGCNFETSGTAASEISYSE
jgi:hypothetical protein